MFKTQTEIYLEDNTGKYARVVIDVEPGGVYNIVHTFVSEDHRGEGLAAKLMLEAISYINSQNGSIKADCSYAEHYLVKHGINHVKNDKNVSCSLKHMKEDMS